MVELVLKHARDIQGAHVFTFLLYCVFLAVVFCLFFFFFFPFFYVKTHRGPLFPPNSDSPIYHLSLLGLWAEFPLMTPQEQASRGYSRP